MVMWDEIARECGRVPGTVPVRELLVTLRPRRSWCRTALARHIVATRTCTRTCSLPRGRARRPASGSRPGEPQPERAFVRCSAHHARPTTSPARAWPTPRHLLDGGVDARASRRDARGRRRHGPYRVASPRGQVAARATAGGTARTTGRESPTPVIPRPGLNGDSPRFWECPVQPASGDVPVQHRFRHCPGHSAPADTGTFPAK